MGFESSWAGKLDRALLPFLGPAEIGTFGPEPPVAVEDRPCPLCARPMREHRIERSGGNVSTRLHCPR